MRTMAAAALVRLPNERPGLLRARRRRDGACSAAASPGWLDIELALAPGLIAALLTFIPDIGPVLLAVPAVLLGLS